MNLLEFLRAEPAWLLAASAVLGLVTGSFLNVVIHRLPRMMQARWRSECLEYLRDLGETALPRPEPAPFTLVVPRSRCPQCGHAIGALENIPVLSWLWLRGRCRGCGARISARYPVVELLTAALFTACAWRFGAGPAAAGAMALSGALVALAFIDLDHQYLPDEITLPWLWAGLLLNVGNTFVSLQEAVIGAAAGYLVLWSVYRIFKAVTGKEGMGYGDFKLLAMLGAWLGWGALPGVILISSVIGAATGLTLIALGRHRREKPIPFGPYLAGAGWVMLVWGPEINRAYLAWLAA